MSEPKAYHIRPVPAPRMTRSDKWSSPARPCVQRYWDFRKQVQDMGVEFNSGDEVAFLLPMPESWSKKKKNAHWLMPHRGKPDLDNLMKALLDALFEDDAHLYSYHISKWWAYEGGIIVSPHRPDGRFKAVDSLEARRDEIVGE